MSSKYSNLPDIDTTNPDIYETPDVPASFSFGHESDSDDEHEGLNTSGSSSNLLAAARHNGGSTSANGADEAINGAKLNIVEARDRFKQSNVNGRQAALLAAARASGRQTASMLPESNTYTLRHRGPPVSSTALRQIRRDRADRLEEYGAVDEVETPTERLRRLRFEMEELEQELEEQQKKRGNEADLEDQYEPEDLLPIRDDADKNRPTRRRKKKAKVDENGEISPAILLSQLKQLRGSLGRLSIQEGVDATTLSPENRDTHNLLARLGEIESSEPGPAREDTRSGPSRAAEVPISNASTMDKRIATLERYIGANEADIDESRPLPPPLLRTLAQLEQQLHLFTQPRHLETISRRVKLLVTDLERVHEARRKIGDTRPLNVALASGITIATGPTTSLLPSAGNSGEQVLPPDTLQKIDGLFTLLPRIDSLIPLTPHLLTRLKSLATLHSTSSTFHSDLDNALHDVDSLKQSELALQELLQGLGTSLTNNQEVVKSNLASLQGRIDQVMARLEALNGV